MTQIIADEFGENIPDFIEIENPRDNNYQRILETVLDAGEASAIALSLEKEQCLLILDDLKARIEAEELKLDYTGTIGIFVVAYKKGLIKDIYRLAEEIRKTDFRISERYLDEMIKRCR